MSDACDGDDSTFLVLCVNVAPRVPIVDDDDCECAESVHGDNEFGLL